MKFNSPSSSLILFLAACAIILGIGYTAAILAPGNPIIPPNTFDSILLPNTVGVFPEPRDMFVFVVLLLSIPVVVIATAMVAARIGGSTDQPAQIFWAIIVSSTLILITGHFIQGAFILFKSWSALTTILIVALMSHLVLNKPKVIAQKAHSAISLLIALAAFLILAQRVWTEESLLYGAPISSHYEAVTSAVVRISTGGTCLADVIAQYGCYGEYLAPVLQMLGRDVFVVSSLFALLLIAAVWATATFAQHLVFHPTLRIACLLCIIIAAGFNLVYYVNDPVLQYFPLRFVLPALSLLLAIWFQKSADWRRALALGLFSGFALTWNLESGAAITISFLAFVTFGNFTERPWLTRTGWATAAQNAAAHLIAGTCFVSAFIVFLMVKSEVPVDLGSYVIYQKVFSMTGFGMIPLSAFPDPLVHTCSHHLWSAHLRRATNRGAQRPRQKPRACDIPRHYEHWPRSLLHRAFACSRFATSGVAQRHFVFLPAGQIYSVDEVSNSERRHHPCHRATGRFFSSPPSPPLPRFHGRPGGLLSRPIRPFSKTSNSLKATHDQESQSRSYRSIKASCTATQTQDLRSRDQALLR